MEDTRDDRDPVENIRQRWSLAMSLGAVLSAFASALCCVGPLVLALLGLSGAGLLVRFETYRPYLVAVALGLLGMGFYLAYRQPQTAQGINEASECACPAPGAKRSSTIVL